MRTLLRIAPLTLVVILLAGCGIGAAPSASASRTRTVTPSPTPTATANAQGVARIELDPQHTVALDEDGKALFTVAYDENPKTALATLTSALGASPKIEKDPSDADAWGLGGSFFDWGGLQMSLYERGPGDEGTGQSILQLTATAPTVQGVVVEGPSHTAVGESAEDASAHADTSSPAPNNLEKGEVVLGHWTRAGDSPTGSGELTDWVVAGTEGGKVSYIRATDFDYGA